MKKLLFLIILILSVTLGYSQSKKISALPTAINLNSSYIPIIQDSLGSYVNRKIAGTILSTTPLANNGLSLSGDTVQLGGTMNRDTTTISLGTDKLLNIGIIKLYNQFSYDQAQFFSEITDIDGYWSNTSNFNPYGIDFSNYRIKGGLAHQSAINVYEDGLTLSNQAGSDGIILKTGTTVSGLFNRLQIDSVGNVSLGNNNTNQFFIDETNTSHFGKNALGMYSGNFDNFDSIAYFMLSKNNPVATSTFEGGYYSNLYSSIFRTYVNTADMRSIDAINNNISQISTTAGGTGSGIILLSQGGTVYVQTNLSNTSGIERLKIDSVGNVSFNNINDFQSYSNTTYISNSAQTTGVYIDSDDITSSVFNASRYGYTGNEIISTGVKSSLMTTNIATNKTGLTVSNTSTDNSIYLVSKDIERLKIDSLGTVTLSPTKLAITEGSNKPFGVATLSGGTVTVSNTAVTANSRIMLTTQTVGGTIGIQYISAKVANTSFTITSSSGTDTSTVAYLIIN